MSIVFLEANQFSLEDVDVANDCPSTSAFAPFIEKTFDINFVNNKKIKSTKLQNQMEDFYCNPVFEATYYRAKGCLKSNITNNSDTAQEFSFFEFNNQKTQENNDPQSKSLLTWLSVLNQRKRSNENRQQKNAAEKSRLTDEIELKLDNNIGSDDDEDNVYELMSGCSDDDLDLLPTLSISTVNNGTKNSGPIKYFKKIRRGFAETINCCWPTSAISSRCNFI